MESAEQIDMIKYLYLTLDDVRFYAPLITLRPEGPTHLSNPLEGPNPTLQLLL